MTGSVRSSGGLGVVAAAALGVGGMMGAGLYTLLGLAATSTGSWLPVAFLLAGVAAAFSVYSYSRLGATFPSKGERHSSSSSSTALARPLLA